MCAVMLKNFSIKTMSFASALALSSFLAGANFLTSSFAMMSSTDAQADWNSYTSQLKLPGKQKFAAILDMADKVVVKGYCPPKITLSQQSVGPQLNVNPRNNEKKPSSFLSKPTSVIRKTVERSQKKQQETERKQTQIRKNPPNDLNIRKNSVLCSKSVNINNSLNKNIKSPMMLNKEVVLEKPENALPNKKLPSGKGAKSSVQQPLQKIPDPLASLVIRKDKIQDDICNRTLVSKQPRGFVIRRRPNALNALPLKYIWVLMSLKKEKGT